MAITTSIAASTLDVFAMKLGMMADAKPLADDLLDLLSINPGSGAPQHVLMSHADVVADRPLHGAWDQLHETVRRASEVAAGAPTFGTAGVRDARMLLGRLVDVDARMSVMEANPTLVRDVADIAYDVRSRVDDVVGRGIRGVTSEAQLLRAIE